MLKEEDGNYVLLIGCRDWGAFPKNIKFAALVVAGYSKPPSSSHHWARISTASTYQTSIHSTHFYFQRLVQIRLGVLGRTDSTSWGKGRSLFWLTCRPEKLRVSDGRVHQSSSQHLVVPQSHHKWYLQRVTFWLKRCVRQYYYKCR